MTRYAFAVDLGATNVRVALVSEQGKIIQRLEQNTPRQGKSGHVVTNAVGVMLSTLQGMYAKLSVSGIGIASLGPIDYLRGGPEQPPNLPFAFIPLVVPLQKKFSMPVLLFNDCNAAVLAEQNFGAGKNKKNILYITISTGIGAGAIVDNNLLLGRSGNAGEIGHITIDTTYNLPCTCGKGIGHWEGYASGRNIPRFFNAWCKKWDVRDIDAPNNAKDIFDRARQGNQVALRFLNELNTINARAISNVIVAYDPEVITIGGSVMLGNASLLMPGIQKKVDQYLKKPVVKMTSLGHDAGLLGAAAAVFKN